MPSPAASVPNAAIQKTKCSASISSKKTHLPNANRRIGEPRKPRNAVAPARATSGPVIEGGDSCGCAVPRYSPKNVSSTMRVV